MVSEAGKLLQVVLFQLGNELYALDILRIQQIIKVVPVTRVPLTSPWIEGVINLRGQILPLLNLRRRLGMDTQSYTSRTRFIITHYQCHQIGLVVDSVMEVLRIPQHSLIPVPTTTIDNEYIRCVSKLDLGLVIILDPDSILKFNYVQREEQESLV